MSLYERGVKKNSPISPIYTKAWLAFVPNAFLSLPIPMLQWESTA